MIQKHISVGWKISALYWISFSHTMYWFSSYCLQFPNGINFHSGFHVVRNLKELLDSNNNIIFDKDLVTFTNLFDKPHVSKHTVNPKNKNQCSKSV